MVFDTDKNSMDKLFLDTFIRFKVLMSVVVFFIFICYPLSILAETGLNNNDSTKILESTDPTKVEQLHKLATNGDREAQFRLGLYYDYSSQIKGEDVRKSIHWYGLAAEQGHTLAQYSLGVKYMQGKGLPKNVNKALSLWLLSANAGHMQSQFNVGRAYFLGIGLSEDQRKAKFWFQKAAAQGDPKSIELLSKIEVSTTNDTQLERNNDSSIVQSSIVEAQSQTIQPITELPSNSATKKGINVVENKALKNIDKPIGVYSGPHQHNQFIMQLPSRSGMSIIEERGENWLKVALEFPIPVWVNEKYLSKNDRQNKKLRIEQKGVFARAVPNVVKGSVLGFFTQGEEVMPLEKNDNWHKVYPKTRFNVWVKRQDWSSQ